MRVLQLSLVMSKYTIYSLWCFKCKVGEDKDISLMATVELRKLFPKIKVERLFLYLLNGMV